MRGHGIALREQLDRVADAHRERAAVEQGEGRLLDFRNAYGLQQDCDEHAQHAAGDALHERQVQRVITLRERADQDHVQRDHGSAEELQAIAIGQGSVLATEVKQPDRRAGRPERDAEPHALTCEHAEHGDDHHVHRADEPGIGDRRVAEADLLRADRHGHDGAEQTARQPGASREARGARDGLEPDADDCDDHGAEQEAQPRIEHGADGADTETLYDEGAAPEQRRREHPEIGAQMMGRQGGGSKRMARKCTRGCTEAEQYDARPGSG